MKKQLLLGLLLTTGVYQTQAINPELVLATLSAVSFGGARYLARVASTSTSSLESCVYSTLAGLYAAVGIYGTDGCIDIYNNIKLPQEIIATAPSREIPSGLLNLPVQLALVGIGIASRMAIDSTLKDISKLKGNNIAFNTGGTLLQPKLSLPTNDARRGLALLASTENQPNEIPNFLQQVQAHPHYGAANRTVLTHQK